MFNLKICKMKITKTTIKSFIKKNASDLYVRVESHFDGMVDCVMPIKDDFKKVEVKKIETQRDERSLGVDGLYLVGSSRNSFSDYEDEKYIGFEVYNCCGSSIIATLKEQPKVKVFKSNDIVEQFIIDMTLIEPVSKIINQLENKEFRDCDIKWLNDKLYIFTAFAAKTLGQKFLKIDLINCEGTLNDYNVNRFLAAFKLLLSYFKSF